MRFRNALLILVTACGSGAIAPSPMFGANTPSDLRELTGEVFAAASEALPARTACLDGMTLNGAWELDDRARYDPGSGEITVRIPATAAQLEISIIHEMAHHAEVTCPVAEDTRREFVAAQGLATDSAWLDGASWEATPSEQWASAVVLHVLERPDERARIAITADAMAIVEAWAVGS